MELQRDRNKRWDPGGGFGLYTIPNHHLLYTITSTVVAATNSDNIENDYEANDDNFSRT